KPAKLIMPRHKRCNEPEPFAGLTEKPPCALYEQETVHPQLCSPVRPDSRPSTTRHPRASDISKHFCPQITCDYRGWVGLGNLRANGHPRGVSCFMPDLSRLWCPTAVARTSLRAISKYYTALQASNGPLTPISSSTLWEFGTAL